MQALSHAVGLIGFGVYAALPREGARRGRRGWKGTTSLTATRQNYCNVVDLMGSLGCPKEQGAQQSDAPAPHCAARPGRRRGRE
jgi:hypothetical protein